MGTEAMGGGAVLSECRQYRYRLWREWGDVSKRVCFVGINPSTADEHDDDHTITKCIGFAKRWGFGALDMVNLFAWRSTDQRGLLEAADPIGVENDCRILQAFDQASRIVLAWGSGKTAAVRNLVHNRVRAEVAMLHTYGPAERGHFGLTYDGFPRHPLMLPYDRRFTVIRSADEPRIAAHWGRHMSSETKS